MDVHTYSPVTGAWLATTPARMSPLEPGVPLVPAHATLIAPPAPVTGQWPRWTGSGWDMVADLRGTEYWTPDGTRHVITALGQTVPVGASLTAPVPSPADLLASERLTMQAYRLAFEDAASVLPLGGTFLLVTIDALLSALPLADRRRYQNITIFERWRPEVAGFLQNPAGINLPDAAIDTLFRLAMDLERGAAALVADPAIPGSAAARARTDQLITEWLAATGG
jgi:hypothetical protein